MTNRSRKAIPFLLALILVAAMSVLIKTVLRTLDNESAGNIEIRKTPNPLGADLTKAILRHKNGELDIVDISAVTAFSWDRLYMIGDYTSASEIDAIVGRSWRKKCYTQISVSDGYTLIVFTANNAVVSCLDYPKNKGKFLIPDQAYHAGLSPLESRFLMNEYGDLIWAGNE